MPRVVVHADWGTDPSKRMMCAARLLDGDVFEVSAPEPVGDLSTFLQRLLVRAAGSGVVAGFDFPIGLPAAYAGVAGIESFTQVLPSLGRGAWSEFYDLAVEPSEIGIRRPFYPYRPGGTKQRHLLDGLGIHEIDLLRRRCEKATGMRGAASPLFWTLGPKQVGRAAIIGWRDLLAPALLEPTHDIKFWPFDGDLESLFAPGRIVVAETYPAEAGIHLGINPPGSDWSKTSQEGRRLQSNRIFDWANLRPNRTESSTGQIFGISNSRTRSSV